MTWIKWWADTDLLTIILTGLSAVICSALSAILIPVYPINLIVVLIICAIGGYIMRKTIIKILDDIATGKRKL